MCRWEKDEEERRIKEEGKRERTALATWRKMLMGLRIIERVREDYGGVADAHIAEEMNPFTNPSRVKKALQADEGPLPHADHKGDIGGGFLIDDDDPDGGDFLPKGRDAAQVRRRAGEFTIEDEKGRIDSDALHGSPSVDSDVIGRGHPATDESERAPTEAGSDDKVTILKKASTNGKRAAASATGPKSTVSIDSPRRRAAPKRKAARKSETALKSHFRVRKNDNDNKSNGGVLTSEKVSLSRKLQRGRRATNTDRVRHFEQGKAPVS